ncbi:MAG TPA: Gfo/Idh/MocA family oxidoreductase [Spirochaetia bacterium]|nr:Gfo/Idh/MocA family oxidoreductase [Spirochaetia bacterium]
MGKQEIGVAVIAAGSRSRNVVRHLLEDGETVSVKSVFDPDTALAERAVEDWGATARICDSYEEAIATPGVDWVMVFSPNAFHREHIVAAFDAGKHVFSEKPLATTIDDCRAIHDAHTESGLTFATGFVLRYAPLYRRVKQEIDAGTIGRILSIDANENIAPAHGAYIMRNWRRLVELSGPHILEKCCHDLDLLNWFVGSVPSRVAAFGNLDFFVPENAPLRAKYRVNELSPFDGWADPHAVADPFESDKTIMDTLVSIMEYRNGVKVQFQATMSNAIPERRMYISGTEGTIIAELYSGSLRVQRVGEPPRDAEALTGGGHGGGDDYIMKSLYGTMLTGTPPLCSGEEGLQSAVVALAIDRAASGDGTYNLEPVWSELGR